MGFQFVVMFIDPFMDDVTDVKDAEVCTYSMICYMQGCICYGSENYGLGSLRDDCVGLADDPIYRDTYLFFYPEKRMQIHLP